MGSEIHGVHTYVWTYSVLQVIQRARSDLHSHGALQITLGLESALRMGDGGPGGLEVRARAILVAANQPHWFESDGWAAVLLAEPETRLGRALQDTYLQDAPIVALPEEPAAELVPELLALAESDGDVTRALELRRQIERAWVHETEAPPPLHPALRRATRHILSLDEVRVSAAELAEIAGVSESHLLHLFGEQLGIPLRRFVLWRRLRRASRAMVDGESATRAAHLAGFHDSSHLTRTFKQLLAVTPSELSKLRGTFDFADES